MLPPERRDSEAASEQQPSLRKKKEGVGGGAVRGQGEEETETVREREDKEGMKGRVSVCERRERRRQRDGGQRSCPPSVLFPPACCVIFLRGCWLHVQELTCDSRNLLKVPGLSLVPLPSAPPDDQISSSLPPG